MVALRKYSPERLRGTVTDEAVNRNLDKIKQTLDSLTKSVNDLSNGIGGDVLGGSFNYDELRATTADEGDVANCYGRLTAHDGGEGQFIWRVGVATDNDGTIIAGPAGSGGYWERVRTDCYYNGQWFGMVGDGSTNNDTAFAAAIAAGGARAQVFLPLGRYVLSSTFAFASTVTVIDIYGESHGSLSEERETKLWVKDVNGFLFDWQACLGSDALKRLSLRGIDFDAANGSDAVADYSTTFKGLTTYAPSGKPLFNVFVSNCTIRRSQYEAGSVSGWSDTSVALNLYNVVFGTVRDCFIAKYPNGFGVVTGGLGTVATTLDLEKVYFSQCLECFHGDGNTSGDVSFRNVVFESSLIAWSQYDTITSFYSCYFENLGGTTSTGKTEAVTKQNLGIADGITDPLDAALSARHGSTAFYSCRFQYLNATPNVSYWYRGNGKAQTFGYAGVAKFYNCWSGSAATTRVLAGETAPTTLEGYSYEVYDSPSQQGSVFNPNLCKNYTDQRLLTRGQVSVLFGTDYRVAIVERKGRFTYGLYNDSHGGWSSAPTDQPTGGQNEIGDRVYFDVPAAAGAEGVICTTAGSPGTWKDLGTIAA